MSYRGRDEYDNYNRRDDYRYRSMDRRDDRDEGMSDYYDSRGNNGYYEDQRYQHQQEKKSVEPEKRIPCSSMTLKDPEAFARLLLLPADVIQNVILQLSNNNKQALVGTSL